MVEVWFVLSDEEVEKMVLPRFIEVECDITQFCHLIALIQLWFLREHSSRKIQKHG